MNYDIKKVGLPQSLREKADDIYTNSKAKINALSKLFFPFPDILKGQSDMVRLAVVLKSFERTHDFYKSKIISDDVFYDTNREGEQMYKIILMKSKTDAHTADLVEDYVKIQNLALQKKKEETIAKWTKEKIGDTYIKINKDYSSLSSLFSKNEGITIEHYIILRF